MIYFRRLRAVFLIGMLGLMVGAFRAGGALAEGVPLSALRADVMELWEEPAPSDGFAEIPQLPEIAQLPDGTVLRAEALSEEAEPRVNTYPFFQKGTAAASGAGSLFALAPPVIAPGDDGVAEEVAQ